MDTNTTDNQPLDVVPPWASVDSREFYENLFRYPIHEAEVVVEDGRTVHREY